MECISDRLMLVQLSAEPEREKLSDDVADKIGIGAKTTVNGRWNSLKEVMLESARQNV